MPVVTRSGFYGGAFKKPGQYTEGEAQGGSETPELVAITHTNLHDAVADALMSLSPEEGGDGVPNVAEVRDHVAAAMGITQAEAKEAVTTKLRNAVWAELQE